jgi:predicted dehydrogenase/type 1 glutamine amidotransferase
MAKKKVLLITGGKYHPWDGCSAICKSFLDTTGRYSVTITKDRNDLKARSLKRFDAVAVYTDSGKLEAAQQDGLVDFVKKGGRLLGLHSATASWQKNAKYIDMIGSSFATHGPILDFPVNIVDNDHVITNRMVDFRVMDEFYILEKYDPSQVEVLATAQWKGKTHPMAYTKEYGEGKIFYTALGHDERVFNHPEYQKLVIRGLDWTFGRKEKRPLKAGVVGYGGAFNMGRMHMEGLCDVAGFEATAVCEVSAERRNVAEEEQPGIQTYSSVTQMLKKSDVEIVVLITPHNSHAKLALQCLNAGRHVITEKPFCITTKEADDMIKAAKKNKVMLSVFHNRRWDGDYKAIHDVVNKGLLGDIFHIEACMGCYDHPRYWWRSDKKISGGAFYDWGAHIVDWVLGLVPAKMTEISGHFQNDRVWHDVSNEDHCNAVVRFDNGCCANIELSHIAAIGKPRWRILGSLGAMTSTGEKTFDVVSFKEGMRVESKVSALEWDWQAYYRNIGDHLLLGEPLVVTPESARRVIGAIETAEKSSKAGKALQPHKSWA